MDIEEKAKELVEKFKPHAWDNYSELYGLDEKAQFHSACHCAIIACDEIIDLQLDLCHDEDAAKTTDYYDAVKLELEMMITNSNMENEGP